MATVARIPISYVTSSEFKIKENEVVSRLGRLSDGRPVADAFEFHIRRVPIKEALEIDLQTLVMAEVTKAYSQIKVPCIVEHAGLIFDGYDSYPGGLTKPMWDFLKDKFIEETHSKDRKALARAVIAYCDGKTVRTFVGETPGHITDTPRGKREFYWDTVFVPDDPDGTEGTMTYAEIVQDPNKGLDYKMSRLSQSTRAMLKFLDYRSTHSPDLWKNP